eukprot:704672-Amphidinium_carterae.1
MASEMQWKYAIFDGTNQSRLNYLAVVRYTATERVGGPVWFFQLREPAAAIGYRNDLTLPKWLKEAGSPKDLAKQIDDVEVSMLDMRPSLKQGQFLKLSADRLGWLQVELVCSAPLFVIHLMHWQTRLKDEQRRAASLVAKDILCKVFNKLWGDSVPMGLLSHARSPDCSAAVIKGACANIQTLVDSYMAPSTGMPLSSLHSFFAEVHLNREVIRVISLPMLFQS